MKTYKRKPHCEYIEYETKHWTSEYKGTTIGTSIAVYVGMFFPIVLINNSKFNGRFSILKNKNVMKEIRLI